MTTNEKIARDRVSNAMSGLFTVESMLPDSDERRVVYGMRVGLNTLKERLVDLATRETSSAQDLETALREAGYKPPTSRTIIGYRDAAETEPVYAHDGDGAPPPPPPRPTK